MVMSVPYEGVNPYAARPGVDVEDEDKGQALRAAVWDLFEIEAYSPEAIRDVFESLLTDIAVEHGYYRDADGVWHWLPDYVYWIEQIGIDLARNDAR